MKRLIDLFRRPPTEVKLDTQQLRDIAQFTAGYTLAMQSGLASLEDSIVERAMNNALAQLEPSIVKRVEAAKVARAKDIVTLQSKLRDLGAKRESATGADRLKYDHYIEALKWALGDDSNGD